MPNAKLTPPKECPRCWLTGTMHLLKTDGQWGHTCAECDSTWPVPNALVDYPRLRHHLVRATEQAHRFINRGIAMPAARAALERDRKKMAEIRKAYTEALRGRPEVAA
jgi:transposase-like protein